MNGQNLSEGQGYLNSKEASGASSAETMMVMPGSGEHASAPVPNEHFDVSSVPNGKHSSGVGMKIALGLVIVILVGVVAGLVFLYLSFMGKPQSAVSGTEFSSLQDSVKALEAKVALLENSSEDNNQALLSSTRQELYRMERVMRTIDSDGDGLPDVDEVEIYTTSAMSADTDGDGFSDSQEVAGGYNPLGQGKVEMPALVGEYQTQLTGDLTVNDLALTLNSLGKVSGTMTAGDAQSSLDVVVFGKATYDKSSGQTLLALTGEYTDANNAIVHVSITMTAEAPQDGSAKGTYETSTLDGAQLFEQKKGEFTISLSTASPKEISGIYRGGMAGNLTSTNFALSLKDAGVATVNMTVTREQSPVTMELPGTYTFDTVSNKLSGTASGSVTWEEREYPVTMKFDGIYYGNKKSVEGTWNITAATLNWINGTSGTFTGSLTEEGTVADALVGTWEGTLTGESLKANDVKLVFESNGNVTGTYTHLFGGQEVTNAVTGSYTFDAPSGKAKLTLAVQSSVGLSTGQYTITATEDYDSNLAKMTGAAELAADAATSWMTDTEATLELTQGSTAAANTNTNGQQENQNEQTNSANTNASNLNDNTATLF